MKNLLRALFCMFFKERDVPGDIVIFDVSQKDKRTIMVFDGTKYIPFELQNKKCFKCYYDSKRKKLRYEEIDCPPTRPG